MATVKVYSRLEGAHEFADRRYSQNAANGGLVVLPVEDEDRIILNGINEVVNHSRIVVPYAATVFSDDLEHDIKKRTYTLQDLERLKENPVFKQMLKNGDVSIDTPADISRDLTGIGKLSNEELAERAKHARDDDATVRLSVSRS